MSFIDSVTVGSTKLLILNDPKRRNILSRDLSVELSAAVKQAQNDPDTKAIIITGNGSSFCAGADLTDLKNAAAGETEAINCVYNAFLDVANASVPTIAAVNGPAVGAGMNLALACDIRIAGEAALFDTRFLKIGLHPGGGHSWMLLRAVGWQTATRMLLLGDTMSGSEAAQVGLAARCVNNDVLRETATTMAGRLADVPRELVVRTKATMRETVTMGHRASFEHETAEQNWSLQQPAFLDLIGRVQDRVQGRPNLKT